GGSMLRQSIFAAASSPWHAASSPPAPVASRQPSRSNRHASTHCRSCSIQASIASVKAPIALDVHSRYMRLVACRPGSLHWCAALDTEAMATSTARAVLATRDANAGATKSAKKWHPFLMSLCLRDGALGRNAAPCHRSWPASGLFAPGAISDDLSRITPRARARPSRDRRRRGGDLPPHLTQGHELPAAPCRFPPAR